MIADAVRPAVRHLEWRKGTHMSDKLLRRPDVLHKTGIGGTSTLYESGWPAASFPGPSSSGQGL
jgi:predicted DNA-binding transcriptional regulator AlpA